MENHLVIITPEAIKELAASSAVAAVRQELPTLIRQANQKPYLTKKELMDLTGWSSRSVEYKKAEGKISYIRQGRLCLFPTDDIMAWLEEGRVPANEAA